MSLPILAKEEVLERVDGDIPFLVELTNQFLSNFPSEISALQSALNQSNSTEVEMKAHAFKGALRNLGGLKSGQIAYAIEMAAKQDNLTEIKPLVKDLADAVAEFENEFKKFISTQR